jgi:hypothetical protein
MNSAEAEAVAIMKKNAAELGRSWRGEDHRGRAL